MMASSKFDPDQPEAPPSPQVAPRPAALARWFRARLPFLALGATVIAGGLAAALLLPLRADIHVPATPWSLAWWLEPQETNGFARAMPPVAAPAAPKQQQQQNQSIQAPGIIDQETGHLLSLALQPGGSIALAVGRDGAVWRSADAGRTWHPLPLQGRTTLPRVAIAADGRTAFALSGFAVGLNVTMDDENLRSRDGGLTWRPAGRLRGDGIALSGNGAMLLIPAEMIHRSTDGGQSWTAIDVKAEATAKGSVAISRDGMIALVGGDGGLLLRSGDGGASWTPQRSGLRDVFGLALSADGDTAMVLGAESRLLLSLDGGAIWTPDTLAPDETMYAIALSPDGETALIGGEYGKGWRRSGRGDWEPVFFGTTAEIRALAVNDDGTALALGSGDTILRSTDGGRSWAMPAHRAAPAPIAWVLLGAGFLALLPAFMPVPREVVVDPGQGIAGQFATDRPLREGDADAAGAGALAERISRFLRNRHTEPPLTLAITGPWGTGKSSVLNRLVSDLERHGLRPVWFNAWHHQKEEHLFAALLEQVRRQAVPPLLSRAGIEVRWRLFAGRLRRDAAFWLGLFLLLAFGAGLLAASEWPRPHAAWVALQAALGGGGKGDWTTALGGLAPVLTALLAVLKFAAGFGDRLKSSGLDPGRLMAAASGATGAKALGAQLAFRVRFAEALGEVAAALGDRTLTVVVDDLDRCRPDQVAEAMEAINFLTSAAGCFVVLGIAREQVLLAMGLAHKDMAQEMAEDGTPEREARTRYAEHYLQKLIQIEVPVPRFDPQAATRLVAAAQARPGPKPQGDWRAVAFGTALAAVFAGAFALGMVLHDAVAPPAPKPVTADTAPARDQGGGGSGGQIAAPNAPATPAAPGRTRPTATGAPVEVERVAASPLPAWGAAALVLATLSVAGAAAWVQARRREQVVVEDAPDFARALDHWAHAAFLAQPSPRQMKRFLNRLRFVAAVEDSVLSGPTAVGLGVLAHAGVLEDFVEGGEVALDALEEALREAIAAAMEGSAEVPPFRPRRAEARAFLALWRGLTVRG